MGVRAIIKFDRAIEEIYKIDDVLRPLFNVLDDKEYCKKRLETKISELDGVDYKVAVLQMQGKSLLEISYELGYSLDWMKRISARISNRLYKKASRAVR